MITEREFDCECHDTDAEHAAWESKDSARWRAYFGLTGDRTTDRRKLEVWASFVKKVEAA